MSERPVYIILHQGQPLHATLSSSEASRLLDLDKEAAEYSGSNQVPYLVELALEMDEASQTAPETEKPTAGPWEIHKHKESISILEDEYGVYPPLGERGPVAVVSGETNAQFITEAKAATDAVGMRPLGMVTRRRTWMSWHTRYWYD